jgi:hypothetical protein
LRQRGAVPAMRRTTYIPSRSHSASAQAVRIANSLLSRTADRFRFALFHLSSPPLFTPYHSPLNQKKPHKINPSTASSTQGNVTSSPRHHQAARFCARTEGSNVLRTRTRFAHPTFPHLGVSPAPDSRARICASSAPRSLRLSPTHHGN